MSVTRSQEYGSIQTLSETTTHDTGCNFDSGAARTFIGDSMAVGAAIGAIGGGITSLVYFGSQFLQSGASCPTNPINPCDGGPGVILLGCMVLPGVVVGGAGGCVAGTAVGVVAAPCVGFYSASSNPRFFARASSNGPVHQSMLEATSPDIVSEHKDTLSPKRQ